MIRFRRCRAWGVVLSVTSCVIVGTVEPSGAARALDCLQVGTQSAHLEKEDSAARRGSERQPELKIRNVRLEPDTLDNGPSVVLKFETLNQSPQLVRTVALAVSIVRLEQHLTNGDLPVVIGGPFRICGDFGLRPGGVANFEMVLRNVAVDCHCEAKIELLSARSCRAP